MLAYFIFGGCGITSQIGYLSPQLWRNILKVVLSLISQHYLIQFSKCLLKKLYTVR